MLAGGEPVESVLGVFGGLAAPRFTEISPRDSPAHLRDHSCKPSVVV